MRTFWWVDDIALSSYPEAQAKASLLGAEFDAPRILVPAGENVHSLFEPFELVRFSSDHSWLSLRWQSRIVCDSGSKWQYGKLGLILSVAQLSSLELEAESWSAGSLHQTWLLRIAVDPHRIPLKEVIVGKHPKMAPLTLWFFMWEGIEEDCFQLHMAHLRKYISFFDTIVISLALNSDDNELRIRNKVLKELNHPRIGFISGLNRKNTYFLDLIRNPLETVGDIVFYANAKQAGDGYGEAWIELMYKFCVANWDTMLSHSNILQGGAFASSVSHTAANYSWTYSGGFAWYRKHALSSLGNKILQSEAPNLPSLLDPLRTQSLIFHGEILHPPSKENARLLRQFWRDTKPILDTMLPKETVNPCLICLYSLANNWRRLL